jgi:GTP cyclohydrolase I
MNAPEKLFLPDIQATPDAREIAIDRVGVKSVRHPVVVARRDGSLQATVAIVDMYVALPHHVKGTHMSRFLEVLQAEHGPMTAESFRGLMMRMLARLDAEAGYIEARFPYFIEKRAPVSNVSSLLDYDVVLRGEATPGRGLDFSIKVVVPVTSLCPCSKKISDYGAHNQRSHVTIAATVGSDVTIEELVAIAEQEASCEVYGLLKRPDEKYVTERAYDNPKFVEDMVRDVARHLLDDPRVLAFTVESENFESIHNHSAYALIQRDKRTA